MDYKKWLLVLTFLTGSIFFGRCGNNPEYLRSPVVTLSPQPSSKSTVRLLTQIPSPVVIPFPLITRDPSDYLPAYTPIPILSPEKERALEVALKDDNCKFPCYLGITPGKTSWEDAQAIMDRIGGTAEEDYYTNHEETFSKSYTLFLGDTRFALLTPDRNTDFDNYLLSHFVRMRIGRNIVQEISYSVRAKRFMETYRDFWGNYTLPHIFRQYNLPDAVYFAISEKGPGYVLVLAYEKYTSVIEIHQVQEGDSICPISIDARLRGVSVRMQFSSTDFFDDMMKFRGVPLTERNVYLPLEEVLGISRREFYQSLIKEPSSCFEIKKVIPYEGWPDPTEDYLSRPPKMSPYD